MTVTPVTPGNPIHERHLAALRQVAAEQGLTLGEAAPDAAPEALGRAAGLDERALARARAAALDVPWLAEPAAQPASAAFVRRVPIGFARRRQVLGLALEGEAAGEAVGERELAVAVADPGDWQTLETVRRLMGRPVRPLASEAQALASAINAAYQQRTGAANETIQQIEAAPAEQVLEQLEQLEGREDLLDSGHRAPVIKLVNLVLFEAVQQRASDVHIQPYEEKLVVRYRIDGVLFDAHTLGRGLLEEIVSRVKVMAQMDIAEKRLAQDGRASVQVGDRAIDLRIASLPTSFGERIVIRLLDNAARLYDLGEVGMDPATVTRFRELISVEHGLVLVTGPTGSGKTTTLYAALQELNATELNVLTLEDPIEYQLPGISQTQVSGKKGMTFASGLRHVLRQDPDIVMVGEIRDRETAVMAIQSALTGHVVFSTLHTNDAASAVTRLLDLGIESYLVASSLIGVLAQRLVRRVCEQCAEPAALTDAECQRLGLDPARLAGGRPRRGRGCPACRGTGFAGRTGLFELLAVDPAVRQCIQQRATAAEVMAAAEAAGTQALREAGIARILAGQTTAGEVLRVTMRSESRRDTAAPAPAPASPPQPQTTKSPGG